MDIDNLAGWLQQRLTEPLPGRDAQLKMSSMKRIRQLLKFAVPAHARSSAVLILLYPLHGTTGLVLMQRPEYPGVHGGQISLPGGKYEEGDADSEATALREAKEEIGVNVQSIHILGRLTPLYIPPSNFLVTPVIGMSKERPVFHPDPEEVSGVIEIRVEDLLDDRLLQTRSIRIGTELTLKAPAYCINGHVIWGATAMILSELKVMLEDRKKQ